MTIAGTTGTSQKFEITPSTGYQIYRVVINGQVQTIASTYTISYNAAKLSQSITAYFQPVQYKLTPSAGTGGTIYPYTVQTVNAGSSKSFSINANSGSIIADVKVNGTSVGAMSSYTFTNIQADATIDASFTVVKANAGGNRTIVAEGLAAAPPVPSMVNLDASASTGATAYTWSFNSIPAGSTAALTNANAVSASFNADILGPYYVRLTAANGGVTSTSDITINVVKDASGAAATCISCHNSSTEGAAIIAGWNASSHKTAPFGCEGCHVGADNAMPGALMNVSNTTFKALTTAGPLTKGEPTCFSFVSPSGCHNSRYTSDYTNRLSISSHPNATVCSSCHGTDMHAQDGQFINKCGKCHTSTAEAYDSKHGTAITSFSCRSCHTGTVGYGYNPNPTVNGSSMSFARVSSASANKHRPEMFQWATSDACAVCHNDLRTQFRTTKHWNNNLEYGPEFAGGAVAEQMNANESWTTTEYGTLTTCSIRCHFKPNLGPDPKARNLLATMSDGKDECLACHDPHKLTASYLTCHDCHRQTSTTRPANTGHGLIPAEFYGSAHWKNNLENGPEFASQLNTTYAPQLQVADARVLTDGTTNNGVLNANDSYQTTENGAVVTCAYRCHFRPGLGPQKDVPGVLANGKSTTYVTYTDTLGNYTTPGTVYRRPGGDACLACHDEHGLEATAQSTCYVCHSGSKHGWSVRAYEKSTHFSGTYAKLEGVSKEACLACHNAHSTEATFGAYSTLTPVAATGCQTCHTPGAAYGIYSSNQIAKAPHGGGQVLVKAQYLIGDKGNNCADCHNHNNVTNTEYAKSSHGNVNGEAWWHYDWLDASRLACARCHSTTGYVNDISGMATTANPGKPGQVLTCNGCHTSVEKGTLRTPGAFTLVASNGATAAYPDVAGSNLCVRCHGARETGDSIKNSTDADGVLSFINSHYLGAAGTLFTAAGYEFAGQSYDNAGYHKNVGVANTFNTGTSGPCVDCHMKSGTSGHGWEVVAKDVNGVITGITSNACAKCHGGLNGGALEVSRGNYEIALNGLKDALAAKGINFYPAHPYFFTAPYVIGGTNTGFTNWAGVYGFDKWKDVMGAAFNYNLLEHEPGAFAHNRQYALKLITDSIDFISDGVLDGQGIAAEVATAATNDEFAKATTHPAAIEAAADANSCATCHQAAPHYGGAFNGNAQFVANNATCSDCHAGGNTAANNAILLQYRESAHGYVAGAAWKTSSSHDWPNANICRDCHSTTGFTAKVGGTARTTVAAGAGQTLACDACHTSVETGAVRPVSQITAYYKARTFNNVSAVWHAPAPAVFPNVGAGNNTCIQCHAGRESGESILALADSAMANTSFKNPHYLGAAGMMYAKLAFIDFVDRNTVIGTTTYGKSLTANEDGGGLTSTHRKLGTPEMATDSHVGGQVLVAGGPCVTCHMSNVKDHTWEINANAFNEVCVKCHTAEGTTTLTADNFKTVFLEEQAVPFNNAVDLAIATLKTQFNITYSDSYPYFFDDNLSPAAAVKDWTRGGALSAADAKKLHGACLNIKLMKADPAAYVHSRTYARRVLYDTIDWLDDKTINMSAVATAVLWNPVIYVVGPDANAPSTESTLYLKGYSRTTKAWNTLERP
jgi:hypothetical protein